MKILMIVNTPNSRTAGMARHTHYVREEMIRMGHKVDVIFAEDVPTLFPSRRIAAFLFPFLLFVPFWKLSRRNGAYDIVSIHTVEGALYAFLRKCIRRLPKCVILSYGADELRWELEKEEDRLGYKKLRLVSKLFYYNFIVRQARYATRHADHVNAAANSEKDYYVRAYRRSPKDITVIPNGVASQFFVARDYRRASTKLLFFGGWEWRKGIRYLVEAFSRLAQEFPTVTLWLVGVGTSETGVKSSFPTNLRHRIYVIPWVAEKDVPGVYAAHDIFVFPSMFESMSLVVPEAMASGMPIVTTRACGMQDIIEDGVTGLLVPPRDSEALAKSLGILLKDPPLCAKLGRAAQQKAREITWEKIARQTLQVYERLLHDST